MRWAEVTEDGRLRNGSESRRQSAIPVTGAWGPGITDPWLDVSYCEWGGLKCPKGPHGEGNPYCIIEHQGAKQEAALRAKVAAWEQAQKLDAYAAAHPEEDLSALGVVREEAK